MARTAFQWLATLGLGLVLWAVLRLFLLEAFRIPSSSMEPGLIPGDMVLVSKIAYGPVVGGHHFPGLSHPGRGNLVVFESPESGKVMLVKRLIAMSGDTIASIGGRVVINGLTLDEPYISSTTPDPSVDSVMGLRLKQWSAPFLVHGLSVESPETPTSKDWGPLLVPKDYVMVMGDNRANSYDSRFWGLLPSSAIRGAPLVVYFSSDPYGLQAPRWDRLFRRIK